MNNCKSYKPIKEKKEKLFLFFGIVLFCLVGFGIWYAKQADEMIKTDQKRINCDYAFEMRDTGYLDKFCLGNQDY